MDLRNMMRKTLIFVLVSTCAFALLACGRNSGELPEDVNGQDYFNAKVLEVYDNYVLVECLELTSGAVSEGSQVTVGKDVVAAKGAPEMAVGDQIRVVHSGGVMESYPLQLETVYAIYLLDEDGNVIDAE